jgi:hypothetical protein
LTTDDIDVEPGAVLGERLPERFVDRERALRRVRDRVVRLIGDVRPALERR